VTPKVASGGRLLIVGGSDAGISAAIRARELSPGTNVNVIVGDRFPNYSICGLPFWVSGEVSDHRRLAHRSIGELRRLGIGLKLGQRALRVDPANKVVTALTPTGRTRSYPYDRLLLATGALSARPAMEGLDLPGVFFLRWMADGFALRECLAARRPRSAVIVGSGYIGVEMADALTRRGLSVTIMARSAVLKTVDGGMTELVRGELAKNGVRVIDAAATAIESGPRDRLRVVGSTGVSVPVDLVLVATGSLPNTELAHLAGASLGAGGAIKVNRAMETGIPDVFAAGDCVETWHRLLKRNVYLPLGTTAHKQGLVAGENAVGGNRLFSGSVGTQVVKVFDLMAARTGLLEREAADAGFKPRTVELQAWDHKRYYPGAVRLWLRLTADERTGTLLGSQLVGHHVAEVSKRLDILATAVFHRLTVEQIAALDLSYTPPTSNPWDPIQVCAQRWLRG
jgi:NADPH-dependent 2,4-dienoyl-CoA reductase/sulfur reductase-like enzyme